MPALALPALAAIGVYYAYTALVFEWRGVRLAPSVRRGVRRSAGVDEWLVQAGLSEIRLRDFVAVMASLFVAGTAMTYAVFGAIVPALAVGVFAATFPLASFRVRRANRRAAAQDAWPRLIEEIRILTASLGRSIPQALFEVGTRAPDEMRGAFDAAHREWLISTDFERTLTVLKGGLADPTADATCETLLVAHTVGGSDLDRRLEALAEDRIQDTQGRKDARAKQAGARFARRFVLFVPFGMAVAGMSVGDGRSAFRSATGQFLTLVAVLMVIACWAWAGRILRVPEEERVFFE
ncbi:type II secretion system F family protein [Actinospongicola halichondriae]|uniref:type II secretion system F family protein n=1 Tax=Actinospongicola halichondriae TaxID=3236844 RepID=UPI003D4A3B68